MFCLAPSSMTLEHVSRSNQETTCFPQCKTIPSVKFVCSRGANNGDPYAFSREKLSPVRCWPWRRFALYWVLATSRSLNVDRRHWFGVHWTHMSCTVELRLMWSGVLWVWPKCAPFLTHIHTLRCFSIFSIFVSIFHACTSDKGVPTARWIKPF